MNDVPQPTPADRIQAGFTDLADDAFLMSRLPDGWTFDVHNAYDGAGVTLYAPTGQLVIQLSLDAQWGSLDIRMGQGLERRQDEVLGFFTRALDDLEQDRAAILRNEDEATLREVAAVNAAVDALVGAPAPIGAASDDPHGVVQAAWRLGRDAATSELRRYMMDAGVGAEPYHRLNQEMADTISTMDPPADLAEQLGLRELETESPSP